MLVNPSLAITCSSPDFAIEATVQQIPIEQGTKVNKLEAPRIASA
jgi:hypothetical protein